ncbi:MAG: isochorismatase family protein [Thermoplasmataceae archaeon]
MDIEKVTNAEDIINIAINIEKTKFKSIFSKMEFLGAYEYLMENFKKYKIPTIFVDIDLRKFDDTEYGMEKEYRRNKSMAPVGPFEDEFMKKFTILSERYNGGKNLTVNSINIFDNSVIEKEMQKNEKKVIMLTGFNTDREILINSSLVFFKGFIPVVVSDATSTYSERMFFNSLEFISMYGEVIDSRDLMKAWDS